MKNIITLRTIPLVIVLSLTGCSTYRNVDIHHEATQPAVSYQTVPSLSNGDRVKYVLKSGQKGETVIQFVSDSILTGQNGTQIPLDQIVTLERKEISGGKTAAATGASIGMVAIVVVAAAAVGITSILIAAAG